MSTEMIVIPFDEVYSETEKAYLIKFNDDCKEWIPKSQCALDDNSSAIAVARWLVDTKGLPGSDDCIVVDAPKNNGKKRQEKKKQDKDAQLEMAGELRRINRLAKAIGRYRAKRYDIDNPTSIKGNAEENIKAMFQGFLSSEGVFQGDINNLFNFKPVTITPDKVIKHDDDDVPF